MRITNKFKQISSNVLEYMLENETKIKEEDTITDKVYKLMKKFDFYKNKKNFEKLDQTMEEVVETLSQSPDSLKASKNEIDYFVRDPMVVDNMKESLIFLAAKENPQLANDFISKYKPVVKPTTILKMIDSDNLPALEILLKNPDARFTNNRDDIVNAKMIVDFACQQKKMNFLQFACNFAERDEIFYGDALRYAVKNNWKEGVTYISDSFKDKIPAQEFTELAKVCVSVGNLDMVKQLREVSPDSNIVIPAIPVGQKIKEIRANNAGVSNKNNLTP